jgi:hypothetical protein
MVMMETPENLDFETWPNGPRGHGHNPAKIQNSNIRHDGILSIGNFMLMINNHFELFQLSGNLLKTKKMCSLFSWQHAISYSLYFCNPLCDLLEYKISEILSGCDQ